MPFYGVKISDLFLFARVSRHSTDFNAPNKFLIAEVIGVINFERLFVPKVYRCIINCLLKTAYAASSVGSKVSWLQPINSNEMKK